jgi:excisionase family DNA binding protein
MSDQVLSPNDRWLTAAEAAKYLKVRSRPLLQWVREGSIKGYCLHRTKRHTWRFRIADLDAALGVTAPSTAVVLSSPTSSTVLR